MGPGERATARAAGLVAGAVALACATSPVVASGTGWRHRELGYTIAAPEPGAGPWRRMRVEGTDLAFRGPYGEALSLMSHCTGTAARPRIAARNLTLGLGGATPLVSGPISLRGDAGWAQSFEASTDGVPVRVHTVTLVSGGCTFDWVLSARAPSSESPGAGGPGEAGWRADLRSFDAWWRSFQPPPAPPPGAARDGGDA
jgi:hypothetical protein